MTSGALPRLPWSTGGARLHLPRDLHAAYIVGRMGVATSADERVNAPSWLGAIVIGPRRNRPYSTPIQARRGSER